MTTLDVHTEHWPIRGSFTISRGAKTAADVVVATLADGDFVGRGECVPYARYGETPEGVAGLLAMYRGRVASGLSRMELQDAMPAGAARNALDCAFWDLEAKRTGRSVAALAGLAAPERVTTAYTLSLDTPERMHEVARAEAERPILKLKLGGEGDLERVAGVRDGAPATRLIVDANEGWTRADYERLVPRMSELGVEMIEQPFPANADEVLADLNRPITVCADESCHDRKSLPAIIGRYGMINIKLDKTGGLTEALALRDAARAQGLRVMVGCMLATSLAMAPAMLLAQGADVTDLDGPLLLEADRPGGLVFTGSMINPAAAAFWG